MPVVERPSVVPVTPVLVPPPIPPETLVLVLLSTPCVLEALAPVLGPTLAPMVELVPDTLLVVFVPGAVVFEALELVTMLALVVPLEVGVDVTVAGDPVELASGSSGVLEHAVSANQPNTVGNERIENAIFVDDSCKLLGKWSAPIGRGNTSLP